MPEIAQLRRLVAADFLERTRRYSFLVIMLGTLFFGLLVITGKWSLDLGGYRGEYNSAWVGSLMAGASTIMLGMFGFYLVKNSLGRDRRTRVGEILAATPLSNLGYVLSKFVSNFLVLGVMTAVLAFAAVVMQLLSNVEGGFNLWDLTAPFMFVCLPVLVLVAAAAVLFESVGWLNGTVGNVLYFLVAEFAFVNHLFFNAPVLDFSGFGLFVPSMQDAALAAYPGAELGVEFGFIGIAPEAAERTTRLFTWDGVDWSTKTLFIRLVWIAGAFGLAALAAVRFDRFDPAERRRLERRKKPKRREKTTAEGSAAAIPVPARAEPVPVVFSFNFFRMLGAELRLMLKGYHWSWYLVAAGLIAVQSAVPYDYALLYALPAAWIWPLPLWSAMGTRESRFDTGQLLFSSPYPVSRQFPAVWAAGVLVAVLMGVGMLLRTGLAGDDAHFRALLTGAVFIPSFALALGTVSGSRKLFEVFYLVVWYVGPVNHLAPLDFAGVTPGVAHGGIPGAYLVATLVLAGAAFLSRRRRVAAGP